MRIVFLGTGDIGLPSLEALLLSDEHEVVAVVTQPDKPVGRSQELTPPPIKVRALAAGIPVLQPIKLRDEVQALQAYQAEIFVVVAYGQILSRAVLDTPTKGCLNIHASILPRHRGAAPIQAAIRDGDQETGVTIMWMDEGLDTGDMLLVDTVPIDLDDTGGTLHDKLATLAPGCLLEALELIQTGKAARAPQNHAEATHVKKLKREHGQIDWSQSAVELERLVRAYDPWPGTYTEIPLSHGKPTQLKVHRAEVVEGAEACPVGGTVLDSRDRLLVSCGQGVLELLEVQVAGKKRMAARDFLKGNPIPTGAILG